MKIFVFGSLNIDRVYQVDSFVQAGETIASTDLQVFPGGKGLNQAIALARAGADVHMVGNIGVDGQLLKECLQADRIPTEYLREIDGVSGHAIIQVDSSGENCILLFSGANHKMEPAFVEEVVSMMDEGDLILLQNEINEVPFIMRHAAKAGMKIVFNPSPITRDIESYPLNLVDLCILNEVEGAAMTGAVTPEEILARMAEKYPSTAVVLTLGEEGSYYQFRQEKIRQQAFHNATVDTTAAGDTFTGFFLAGIAGGKSVAESMEIASMAASITISRKGASTSIPNRTEVMEKFRLSR